MSFEDGDPEILENGRGLKVVWADEGFELGDYQDAGFGWYSPDGEQWTAMPFVGTPEVGDIAALRPASAMSWACRTASSRAAPAPLMVVVPRCGIHQTA